jgi:CHAD domain-containing protein/transposase
MIMDAGKEELERLRKLAADEGISEERRRVASILLNYALGMDSAQVAEAAGLSASRARFWRKQYERHGMDVFDSSFSSERRKGIRRKKQAADNAATGIDEVLVKQLRDLDAATLDSDEQQRRRLLLAYAEGKTTAEIASDIGLSQSRTRYWRNAFLRQGMELFDRSSMHDGASPETAVDVQEVGNDEAAPSKDNILKGKHRLDERHSFAEAARIVLAKPFADLRRQSRRNDLGENPEVVHRMRVATRRLRSAFIIFDGAFRQRSIMPLVKGLRRLARLLGRVRDRDVLLIHMTKHIETLGNDARDAFQLLLHVWHEERNTHLHKLHDHISSKQFPELIDSLSRFIASPDEGNAREITNASGVPLRMGTLAPLMIEQRYADILAFGPYLPTATLDLLHGLRIHCKKLRYTMEFFSELLGEGARDVHRQVVEMQDLLGEIQDAQTAGELITSFVDSLEKRQLDVTFTERINPAPLLHYLATRQSEKHELLASVQPAWSQLTGSAFRERMLRALYKF